VERFERAIFLLAGLGVAEFPPEGLRDAAFPPEAFRVVGFPPAGLGAAE
jgi:hypothetical protein